MGTGAGGEGRPQHFLQDYVKQYVSDDANLFSISFDVFMTGIYLAIGSEKQVKPLLFLYLWYVIFTQQVKPKDSPPRLQKKSSP